MKLEQYLDRGVGKCNLREIRVAKIAEDALLHFHGDRYELLAWCVMPNHVHVLVDVKMTPMWKMILDCKVRVENQTRRATLAERRAPSRQVSPANTNEPRRCSALQWQREYWDTFMRDDEQQLKAVHYIENNPVKVRLCRTREGWQFSSARFRDTCQRMILSTKENI